VLEANRVLTIMKLTKYEMMMELLDQAQEPGAKVGAWDANGGPNQLWHFETSSGGVSQSYGQQYQQQQQSYGSVSGYKCDYTLNELCRVFIVISVQFSTYKCIAQLSKMSHCALQEANIKPIFKSTPETVVRDALVVQVCWEAVLHT